MANNDFELRIYIPLSVVINHSNCFPKKEDCLQNSIICSPAVGIHSPFDEKSIAIDNLLLEKFNIQNLLKKMGIERCLPVLDTGKIEWFYPYGIVLRYPGSEELCSLEGMLDAVHNIMKSVALRNITDRPNASEDDFYTIDYNPLYFWICKSDGVYAEVRKKFIIDVSGEECQIDNPIVIFKDYDENAENAQNRAAKKEAIDLSLKLMSTLLNLSYNIRKKLGTALQSISSNRHLDLSDELAEIRERCSLTKELCSCSVLKTNVEKRIYSEISEKFNVRDIIFQIDNAIETIEHYNEVEIDRKAEKMNITLFITGYLGLILAVFAFLPLNFGDLLWFPIPDAYYPVRWAAFISIVIMTVLICHSIYICYKYFDNKKSRKMDVKISQKNNNTMKHRKMNLERIMVLISLGLLILILITVLAFCFLSMLGKYQVHQ